MGAPAPPALRPLRQVSLRACILGAALAYACLLWSCSAAPRGRGDYLKLSGRAGGAGASAGAGAGRGPWGAAGPWAGGPGREPSCEELLAMWRFSKRQSRAAEITNEVATYRDPFVYNVWEPHARSRSGAGAALKGRHVYGRVVHAAPRALGGGRGRVRGYEEVARHLVGYAPVAPPPQPRRRLTSFRFSGGGDPHLVLAPQAGSFQQLKDIIRSERARELQAQRLAEEAAARAAALHAPDAGAAPDDDHLRFGRRSPPPPAPAAPDAAPDAAPGPDADGGTFMRALMGEFAAVDEGDDDDEEEERDDDGDDGDGAYEKYSEYLVPYGG